MKATLAIRVDQGLREQLERLAADRDNTVSRIAYSLLKRAVEQELRRESGKKR